MILSSNTLASFLTVFVYVCVQYMYVCVCARARVCDEWASARRRSLGGLGSICLSVSCQHCQWLTTSSTHSTSLFITTHVTHMRVRAQSSKHARMCARAYTHTHTHTQDILFHYGRRPHWGQSGVGRQRGEREMGGKEMDGCSINTEPHMHLQPLFSFRNISRPFSISEHLSIFLLHVVYLSSVSSYFLTSLHPLSTGLLTTLDLHNVFLPPGQCLCVCVCFRYLRYWTSLSSGQSERTRVPRRRSVGGERFSLAATGVVQ